MQYKKGIKRIVSAVRGIIVRIKERESLKNPPELSRGFLKTVDFDI